MEVQRGSIWIATLNEYGNKTSVQQGKRPIIVTSNEACNLYSPVITAVPVTSRLYKASLPTHVLLGTECGLYEESLALVEQIMPIAKDNLIKKVGYCTDDVMTKIEKAILIQNEINLKEIVTIQPKVIDKSKIKRLIDSVNEISDFINEHSTLDNSRLQKSMELQMIELKNYCNSIRINFYKLSDKYITKLNINSVNLKEGGEIAKTV